MRWRRPAALLLAMAAAVVAAAGVAAEQTYHTRAAARPQYASDAAPDTDADRTLQALRALQQQQEIAAADRGLVDELLSAVGLSAPDFWTAPAPLFADGGVAGAAATKLPAGAPVVRPGVPPSAVPASARAAPAATLDISHVQPTITSALLSACGLVALFRVMTQARAPRGTRMTERVGRQLWVHRQLWLCILFGATLAALIATARFAIEQAFVRFTASRAGDSGDMGAAEGLSDTHLLMTLRRLSATSDAFARAFGSLGVSAAVLIWHAPKASSMLVFGPVGCGAVALLWRAVQRNDASVLRSAYALVVVALALALVTGRRNGGGGWVPGLRWCVVAVGWAVMGDVAPHALPAAVLSLVPALCLAQCCHAYALVLLARGAVEHVRAAFPAPAEGSDTAGAAASANSAPHPRRRA